MADRGDARRAEVLEHAIQGAGVIDVGWKRLASTVVHAQLRALLAESLREGVAQGSSRNRVDQRYLERRAAAVDDQDADGGGHVVIVYHA
jgi:hypothetical protein